LPLLAGCSIGVILGLQNGLDVNSNRLEGCEAWDFARLQNFILDT